ncbi:MAG: ribonuclease E inhibitor RraB [Hyphomicrobiales bacterium]|nr:ribonuclease E inhibitor RraB [Hyphomicrobiales bacterium]
MSDATWIVYFRADEADPSTGRFVSVDQGCADPAIAEQFPILTVFTAELGPERVDDKRLPTQEAGRLLDEAEAVALANVANARLVARITAPGERRWIVCHTLVAKPAMADIARTLSETLDAPVANAPEAWDEIFEIFPSRQEAARFWNWHIVVQLRQNGDDGSAPRRITHSFYDIEKVRRDDLEKALSESGYAIDSHRDDEIVFSRSGSINLGEINSETDALHALADRFNCGYNGWTTELRTEA